MEKETLMNRAKVKKTFAAVVLVACLSLGMAGTLAYFTAEGTAHNVITSGNVSIKLIETQYVMNEQGEYEVTEDGTPVEVPFENNITVMPKTDVSKIAKVENDGFGDAYVRVKVESSIQLMGEDGLADYANENELKKYLRVNFNQSDWRYNQADGWWYYVGKDAFGNVGVLSPRAITEPLFESVTFDETMPNKFQNSVANITVSAQAVQVANNPIPDGGSIFDVQGWPAPDASGTGAE